MEKKKAAIVTLTVANYGNRLQNLATQWVIESFGYETETLHNPFELNYSRWKHQLINNIKRIVGNKRQKLNAKREQSFDRFDSRYIKYAPFWLNNNKHIGKLNEYYDCFVCGSDQLWNPTTYNYGAKNFGMFAENKKKITMAPSFGVDKFPDERKEEFKEYLNTFKRLSVREKSGQDIIYALTGRESQVVIDPTLMIDRDKWEKIAKRPDWLSDKKYILLYALGDAYMAKWVQEVSERKAYEVINLMDCENGDYYCADPSQFLYLIQHCELMITDSFHGSVFSIIFNRPFVVMERKDKYVSMNTRLDNLLDMFGLVDRRFSLIKDSDMFHIDYKHVYKILDEKRQEAYNFVKKAVDEIDED